MTETLNDNRRRLMNKARSLATAAQRSGAPGLIRGDLIRMPYEDLLDTLILLAEVCPVEYMHVTKTPDLVPCGHCDASMVVTGSGARYCSPECRQLAGNARQTARRRAAA